MRLVGERVIIRDISFKDFDLFYEFGSNQNIGPNAGWKPFPNEEIARRVLSGYILNKNVYAIANILDNKFMGTFSIYEEGLRKYKYSRTIGFSLDEKYWGKGIMVEAVNLVVNYLFTKTKCEVIEVGHHSDNYQSKRVIEKCGFNYDGRLCKYKTLYNGRLIDADFYSMTKEDYERKIYYEGIKTKI